jgi:uracil-DNA glycosylase
MGINDLFDEWRKSYPESSRPDFHNDGIVDEETFANQRPRVLFVLAEPNSKDGRYDRYRGADLRKVFGQIGLGKPIDLNLARWASVVLHRTQRFFTPTRREAMMALRAVAIMNMKKLAGSGRANIEAISLQAWRDRAFIRREVDLIRPTIILTCGETACRLFRWVMTDDELGVAAGDEMWQWDGVAVLPVNHASLRPKDAAAAFARVVALVKEHDVTRERVA